MSQTQSPAHRLLIVGIFAAKSSGNAHVCQQLTEYLRAKGWQVVTTSEKVPRLQRLLDMLRTAWLQRVHYDAAQIDVYSGAAFVWAEAVAWLLRRMRKPYVLVLRGGNLPLFAQRWPGRVKRLLRSAPQVVTISRHLQQSLAQYHAAIQIVPNPLDLTDYQFQLRKELSPKLVWLRAFHEHYHPETAVQSVALLKLRFPDLQLVMYGQDRGDGTRQHIEVLCEQLEVADRVLLPGPVPKSEVPHVLAQGDIFLNTTNIESFGVSVIEAGACGLCIITTNVGELPHIWTHEQNALLIPPGDPDALAAAIQRVLTDPDLAAHLSQQARINAERFDGTAVLPQWEALFEELIAQ